MFKNQTEKIEHVRDMEKILKTQTELLKKKTMMSEKEKKKKWIKKLDIREEQLNVYGHLNR